MEHVKSAKIMKSAKVDGMEETLKIYAELIKTIEKARALTGALAEACGKIELSIEWAD